MTFRFTDSPTLIGLPMLERLDADPPGTWLWQQKMDGYRRQIWRDENGYHYRSKNRDDAQLMDAALREECESLDWPLGIGLDCEMMGLRQKGDKPMLYIFDMWMLEGEWCGDICFRDRYKIVVKAWLAAQQYSVEANNRIKLVHTFENPGMVEAFEAQRNIEGSEGIVIRPAVGGAMLGGFDKSKTNPEWFKIKMLRSKD